MSEHIVATLSWGDKVYLIAGTNKKHRANGPAILYGNSVDWYWFLDDADHRYYGSCCSWKEYWFIHGRFVK